MTGDLVHLAPDGAALRLTLAAPRANALTPELLDTVRAALDRVEAAAPETLVLAGGRNFCSGGDVARFLDAAEAGEARAYALRVVPALQEVVLRLWSLPATVILAARGAITGGGAGLLFAADLAVLAPDAFVQPCYGQVGFAPDGGWTALLPDRIGPARALSWIASDRREGAEGLVRIALCDAEDPDPEAAALRLAAADPGTRTVAKALLRGAGAEAALKAGLARETEAFLARIDRPDVAVKMAAFLGRERAHV